MAGVNTSLAAVTSNCNQGYIPTHGEYQKALGALWAPLITVGFLITGGLYTLFLEQVFFSNAGAHRVFRRHIYWIGSVYPFMTLMSVVALLVPRAHDICTAAKIIYMSIGISHFGDLTVLMFGSEEVLLAVTEGSRLYLQVGPACWCCSCLPQPPVSKLSIRVVLWLCDQMPFTQAAYYLTLLVLISNNQVVLGNVDPSGVFLWLNLLNFFSFVSGLFGLNILLRFSKGHLEFYNYGAKSKSLSILVLITNLQSFVFDIMGNYNAFPCIPPYLSPNAYKQTVENTVYIFEMMLLGGYTYWQYHSHEFLKPNPTEVEDLVRDGQEDAASITTVVTTLDATIHPPSIRDHPAIHPAVSTLQSQPVASTSQPPPADNSPSTSYLPQDPFSTSIL